MGRPQSGPHQQFWVDLSDDLRDPEFERQFVLASERVATIDRIVKALDEIRTQRGMTKADLARAAGRTPESLRRLFTAASTNPQLGLIAELAAVLGYRVVLAPMTVAERRSAAVLRQHPDAR